MKHLFKTVILTLGVLLMTFSCQKEDQIFTEESNVETSQDGLIVEIHDWHDLTDENPKIAERINTINGKSFESRVASANYDFSIDDSRVQVIEQENGSTSYTFSMYRENQPEFILENYVYEVYPDGLVNQYIFEYQFSFDEDGQIVFDENYLEIETIEDETLFFSRGNGCFPELVDVTYDTVCEVRFRCTGYWGHEMGDSGCDCGDADVDCLPAGIVCYEKAIFHYSDCDGYVWQDDNSDGDNDPTTNGNPGGTGNNNDPNDPNNPNNFNTPLEEQYKQDIVNCINGNGVLGNTNDATTIEFGLMHSLNLTPGTLYQLRKKLNIGGCSEEAQQEVIDLLLDIYDEVQIINELEGKALCVYNKLKDLSGGFKNAIKKFEPEFPVAHLKFNADDLDDNTRGETSPPENYVITITLNNDSSDSGYDYRPNLLTAKTIIHEVIHAEMFRKLLSLASDNGEIDVFELHLMLQNKDYAGILDYYTRYGLNGFQHQQMATHYRETIARVLQEFDTSNSVPDNQQPLQIYLDLAWEGLNHSNIVEWQDLTTQEEKDRIDLEISNYINLNANETCTE